MEAEAAKFIGAGLAGTALIGAGIGIGSIFSNYLSGALRNPSACLLYTSPSPRDRTRSRMPSSA